MPGRGPEATVVIQPLIDECARCMSLRWKKYKLKRHLSLILYGAKVEGDEGYDPDALEDVPKKNIEISAYEKIRLKAREYMSERASLTQKDARLDSIGLYEQIIEDPKVNPATRIKAQIQLDMILNVNEAATEGTIEQTAAAAVAALAAISGAMTKGLNDGTPAS